MELTIWVMMVAKGLSTPPAPGTTSNGPCRSCVPFLAFNALLELPPSLDAFQLEFSFTLSSTAPAINPVTQAVALHTRRENRLHALRRSSGSTIGFGFVDYGFVSSDMVSIDDTKNSPSMKTIELLSTRRPPKEASMTSLRRVSVVRVFGTRNGLN